MKRILAFVSIIFLSIAVRSQPTIIPTNDIRIFGAIEKVVNYSFDDILKFNTVNVEDQLIYNHSGDVKDTLNLLKGVPLKDFLRDVQYTYEKPKELNEFYFVFTASDGYRVVFSWNEIYNSEAGNSFYIITEMKGKSMKELDQRIVFLSSKDLKSGRRYIKCLQSIEIRKL
jgi:hypothetical protein